MLKMYITVTMWLMVRLKEMQMVVKILIRQQDFVVDLIIIEEGLQLEFAFPFLLLFIL